MNNGKYLSMDRVIENVYRDYGFDNLDWIHCVEWIGECLDLIGAPLTYIEKTTDGNEKLGHPLPITITDNRGHIPCEMYRLIQAFKVVGEDWIPMRVNTDTTHIAYFCNQSEDNGRVTDVTYKLNNGFIFTDFCDGEVALVYLANPTDENGYPMIPDNIKYIKACASYIGLKMLRKRQIQGHTVNPNALSAVEQDSLWYTAAANSSARIPTMDQMESWKNNFVQLIPNINAHATAFRSQGEQEKRFNNSNNSRSSNISR